MRPRAICCQNHTGNLQGIFKIGIFIPLYHNLSTASFCWEWKQCHHLSDLNLGTVSPLWSLCLLPVHAHSVYLHPESHSTIIPRHHSNTPSCQAVGKVTPCILLVLIQLCSSATGQHCQTNAVKAHMPRDNQLCQCIPLPLASHPVTRLSKLQYLLDSHMRAAHINAPKLNKSKRGWSHFYSVPFYPLALNLEVPDTALVPKPLENFTSM